MREPIVARKHNGLLGVGGQRKKISRRELRGGGARPGDAADQQEARRELLRRMRERTARDERKS
ncbi:hypothetical protein GCM10009678_52040 [Actinomadura kijaniata]